MLTNSPLGYIKLTASIELMKACLSVKLFVKFFKFEILFAVHKIKKMRKKIFHYK